MGAELTDIHFVGKVPFTARERIHKVTSTRFNSNKLHNEMPPRKLKAPCTLPLNACKEPVHPRPGFRVSRRGPIPTARNFVNFFHLNRDITIQ